MAVDHKPLLKILGDRSLEDLPNTRLRKLKEKTLRYRFKMVHIPGVKHRAADGLSRCPSQHIDSITTPIHEYTNPVDISADKPCLPINFLANIRCFEPPDATEDSVIAHTGASLDGIRSVTWEQGQSCNHK